MDELENQLHQQLAENDNNRISTFITFIVGIIALFGFYGFVYVNTYKRDWKFDTEEFLSMAFVTIGILLFLSILVLSFGYSFRRDQLIVHNIRVKRYKESEKEFKEVFGKECCKNKKLYFPYNKEWLDFLPDFFNLFYWLFFFSEIFLGFITIKKVLCYIIFCCNCNYNYFCNDIILLMLFIVFYILFIIFTLIARCFYFKKYKDKEKQCQTQKEEQFKDCSLPE